MTDDITAYGLGALPDAPDERDNPIWALYASEGRLAALALPSRRAAERATAGSNAPGPLRGRRVLLCRQVTNSCS